MARVDVTSLSSRGQIVIPQGLREKLKLHEGEKFTIIEVGGILMLRRLKPITEREFDRLLRKTREHARKHGLTEKDMQDAIKKTRKKRE